MATPIKDDFRSFDPNGSGIANGVSLGANLAPVFQSDGIGHLDVDAPSGTERGPAVQLGVAQSQFSSSNDDSPPLIPRLRFGLGSDRGRQSTNGRCLG